MKLTRFSLLCALGLGACDGCGPADAPTTGAPSDGPPTPTGPAAGEPAVGIVHGIVRLAEGALLPEYTPALMEKKVLDHAERGPWPSVCTPPKQLDRQPVRMTPEGGLSGLVLAASQFSRQPQRPQRVHELAIRDCRLEPRSLVAMVGDVVRVKNEVDYPFMPSYGNTPQLRTLSPGQTYDVKLDKPGVTPVLCGFTAPCGRSDVVVMMHPLATVTDEDGSFRIEDFPAGEQVRLSAWHPLFQEAHVTVELTAGETKRVELVIHPTAAPPAPAENADKPAPAPAAPVDEPAAAAEQQPE